MIIKIKVFKNPKIEQFFDYIKRILLFENSGIQNSKDLATIVLIRHGYRIFFCF